MIYNATRQTVARYDLQGGTASLCPLCGGDLVARRGEIVVWHWAHRPSGASRSECPHEESAWHLAMKRAYLFPGWEVESPVTLGGRKYLLDAMNKKTREVREFVHSLSPYYLAKHRTLKAHGYNVLWIFDGEMFVSHRVVVLPGGGLKRLLKPKADMLHRQIGGLVHFKGFLLYEWNNNDVWYPRNGEQARTVLERIQHGMEMSA